MQELKHPFELLISLDLLEPFSDGELVKRCIMESVKCIQRRQFHIAEHLNLSLLQKLNSQTTLFSLTIDESNDICDSAQLIIFIRTLSFDFEIHKDFLSMKSLPGNVRSQDIFEIVEQCCLEFKLDMTCLRGICTDGAPAMLGRKQGFVARLTEYVSEEYNNKSVFLRKRVLQNS
ncbi:protein ZBED8-like [Octopus sinensis]|uniref:Protein ZBED8-like n=1 Tax=Octopus sinensis TaxID=2607531 RepID=A0A6P7TSH2_9MOLL|nr:protein ZBED8-like [Octopus sinensis]